MTATADVTVWCDGEPEAARMSCGRYITGDDAKSARAEAKRLGWQVSVPASTDHSPGHSRSKTFDYCPEHRRT